jgi:DNA transformation protein
MAIEDKHLQEMRELLAPLGVITIRKMFGGAGVYCDGLFFALIDDGELYLKVDDENRAEFEEAGSHPFTYDAGGKPMEMSYWVAPADLYESESGLVKWANLALDAARRKPPTKKRKKL